MKTSLYKFMLVALPLVFLSSCSVTGISYVRSGKAHPKEQKVAKQEETPQVVIPQNEVNTENTEVVIVTETPEIKNVEVIEDKSIQSRSSKASSFKAAVPAKISNNDYKKIEKDEPLIQSTQKINTKDDDEKVFGLIGFLISAIVTLAILALIVALGVITWGMGLGAFIIFLLILFLIF